MCSSSTLTPGEGAEKAAALSSVSGDKLYIVMELIEGTSLAEHFTSLKEKQLQFTEDRIWNVFIQVKSPDVTTMQSQGAGGRLDP